MNEYRISQRNLTKSGKILLLSTLTNFTKQRLPTKPIKELKNEFTNCRIIL